MEETQSPMEHAGKKETWKRGAYMVLFTVIYGITEVIVGMIIVLQFLFVLIGGEENPRLKSFGWELSRYIYAMLQFLTFNTEEKPYPFARWEEYAEEEDESRPA